MRTLVSPNKIKNMIDVLNLYKPEGLIIEVGVYQGGSLLELAKAFPNNNVIGFDTFEGLPHQYDASDEIHKPGEFAASFSSVLKAVEHYPNIMLIKGVFPDSAFYRNDTYAFAHLDMDQAMGTYQAISYVWQRLDDVGVIFIDDYDWPSCPGVKGVVDSFAQYHGIKVNVTNEYQAYLVKGNI